jgi:hypothetical protein
MNLSTLSVCGFNIELPIGLPEVLDTKVRDSYQTFLKESTNDVRRHLTCAATLLPPMMKGRDGQRVLHCFGGLGATAQILDQCAKGLKHEFWERDPVCVEFLCSRYDNVLPVDDTFKLFPVTDLSSVDILLMDMSVGTIKTKGVKEMWGKIAEWMLDHPDRFVWFTDTACHKIHLNWDRYGKDFDTPLPEPTAEAYLNCYSSWLERIHGMTITAAMREAGEIYAIVQRHTGHSRFKEIPYV